jgi:hypothetical protein
VCVWGGDLSNCSWQELNLAVYYALVNDFMKPRIDEASGHDSSILII